MYQLINASAARQICNFWNLDLSSENATEKEILPFLIIPLKFQLT